MFLDAPIDSTPTKPVTSVDQNGNVFVVRPGSPNAMMSKNVHQAQQQYNQFHQGATQANIPVPQAQPQQGFPPVQSPVQQPPLQMPTMPQPQPQPQPVHNPMTPPVTPPPATQMTMNPFQVNQVQPQTSLSFNDLYTDSGETVPAAYVAQAQNNGFSPEQAKLMYSQQQQALEAQKRQLEEQHKNNTAKNLKASEETLKLVWGADFNKNLQAIIKYVESQTPVSGNAHERQESIKKQAADILSNPQLAKNIAGIASQQMTPQQVQGQPPQVAGGANLYGGADMSKVKRDRFQELVSNPQSPLYNTQNPYVRQQAEREFNELSKELSVMDSNNMAAGAIGL